MPIVTPQFQWTFRRVAWATLVLVFVGLGFYLLFRFYQVVLILFFAIIFGTVIRPVVLWLNRIRIHQTAGVLIIYFLLLALLIGFGILLVPLITEQTAKITGLIPGYYQAFRDWMVNSPNQLMVLLSNSLPVTLPALTQVQPTGQQVLASAEQVSGYFLTAAQVIFTAIVILLLTFYWTVNGPRTIQSLLQLVSIDHREKISELISAIETKVGSFIVGQGILCLSIGALALIAYMIIGLPNALVLALFAGLMEAVPMLGPILGAVPAAIIGLSIAPSKLIWVIVASLVIQQLENNLLVPRVMRKTVGVNPFVSLLAIFAFSSLFGIAGALMAIPLAAVIQLLLDHFVFNSTSLESETTAGRDLSSRLRYEAQNLANGLRKQARLTKGGTDLRVKQIDKVMDEIETITNDLDTLLAEVHISGTP